MKNTKKKKKKKVFSKPNKNFGTKKIFPQKNKGNFQTLASKFPIGNSQTLASVLIVEKNDSPWRGEGGCNLPIPLLQRTLVGGVTIVI